MEFLRKFLSNPSTGAGEVIASKGSLLSKMSGKPAQHVVIDISSTGSQHSMMAYGFHEYRDAGTEHPNPKAALEQITKMPGPGKIFLIADHPEDIQKSLRGTVEENPTRVVLHELRNLPKGTAKEILKDNRLKRISVVQK